MPTFDPERTRQGLRDHHVQRRAFDRMDDDTLLETTETVIACWVASARARPRRRGQAWDPAQLEPRRLLERQARQHWRSRPAPLASRDALDVLQGKADGSRELGWSSAPRQIRALATVLRKRGLHRAVVRLGAACSVCRPPAHPAEDRLPRNVPQDAHEHALLDVESRWL
jgi:hypothetical protein